MTKELEQSLEQKLKEPFPVGSLHWRMGKLSAKKDKALMLVYIDARDVMDRLDEVFGSRWSDDYKEVMGRIVCTITIDGISKSDGAGDTDFEAEKGGLSDAFKRAAVKWGIGRYLYEASKYNTWVAYSEDKKYSLYEDNKEQLDKVARILSGLEKTPSEKAKATREENAEKKAEVENKINSGIKYFTGTPNGRQERITLDVLQKSVDLIANGKKYKATNVLEFTKIICQKAKEYIETSKVDLSFKEKDIIEALMREVASLDSSLEEANELARVYTDLDKITY